MIESTRDSIYEIDLTGGLVRTIPHPYRNLVRTPSGSPFGSFSSGVSLVEGSARRELYLTGGTVRDQRQPLIFRLDVESGDVVRGSEITTDGIRIAAHSGSMTLQHMSTNEGSRLIVMPLEGTRSELMAVETPELTVAPAPTFLSCRQRNRANDVEITFNNNGPYDAVEIYRNCELRTTLAGDAEFYIDTGVEPGLYSYTVRGVRGDERSPETECSLRVGAGALLQREFAWPARSPQQIARDPVDGSFYVVVNWPGDEQKVFHYDSGFRFLSVRKSGVEAPWKIAAVAVRITPSREKILYYIAWQQPVPLDQAGIETFLLISETTTGALVDETVIEPPRPTNGFVTFPTALAWDEGSDTFYFLERNSKTFVQIDPNGFLLRTFPHPAPPFQNFVFNLGLAIDSPRKTIFITGSNRNDFRLTKVMGMSFDGKLTGYEIPLDATRNTITGIALDGDDLIAVGTASFSDLLRLKAFEEIPEPYIRGDANRDGSVDINDPVVTLAYLFRQGAPPACQTAADADDSGYVEMFDPVMVLRMLFLNGPPLSEPFPDAGYDPTPDGLDCR